jgi:hypothetical protein
MWLHLPWTTYFSGEVLNGIAYPRWLPEMNEGFGSPVFFYPPIPFFINVPIRGLLPGPDHAPRVLGISTVLSFLIGSAGMYLWLKRFGPRSSAAVGAMFYGVAPFQHGQLVRAEGAAQDFSGASRRCCPWDFSGRRPLAGRPDRIPEPFPQAAHRCPPFPAGIGHVHDAPFESPGLQFPSGALQGTVSLAAEHCPGAGGGSIARHVHDRSEPGSGRSGRRRESECRSDGLLYPSIPHPASWNQAARLRGESRLRGTD